MNIATRELLERAVKAAVSAGEAIHELRGKGLGISYKDGVEPVTLADLRSDALIRGELAAAFPDHRVLSEETAEPDWASAGFEGPLWIIDPIDGTANYSRGHRYVSISIAFAMDGIVQAGVVHAPFLDETFTAIKGQGARLNGEQIRASAPADLKHAVVSTGFPHDKSDPGPLIERVRRLLTGCQDIRRSASPALDIAWVAAGRMDAHTETLAPWDIAAATLIATEAGAERGHLTPVPDDIPADLSGDGYLIAAPTIRTALERLLLP